MPGGSARIHRTHSTPEDGVATQVFMRNHRITPRRFAVGVAKRIADGLGIVPHGMLQHKMLDRFAGRDGPTGHESLGRIIEDVLLQPGGGRLVITNVNEHDCCLDAEKTLFRVRTQRECACFEHTSKENRPPGRGEAARGFVSRLRRLDPTDWSRPHSWLRSNRLSAGCSRRLVRLLHFSAEPKSAKVELIDNEISRGCRASGLKRRRFRGFRWSPLAHSLASTQ